IVHRAVVISNGVRPAPATDDADGAAVRRELAVDDDAPLAVWVGSLDERRDPLAVIRAAVRTSTPLVMVGEGPLRSEAERAARPAAGGGALRRSRDGRANARGLRRGARGSLSGRRRVPLGVDADAQAQTLAKRDPRLEHVVRRATPSRAPAACAPAGDAASEG